MAALILLIAPLADVHAGSSEWAVNEGGRMRLVALAPDNHGKIKAALQIEPAAGWITYWREPGDSGVPPQISIPADSGVTLDKIAYPVPKLISDGTIDDIGYDAPIALPLDLHASAASSMLTANVFIGLCKDICIPFQADLSLALDDQPTADEAAVVSAAAKALPEPPSADFAVEKYQLSADKTLLHLALRLPDGISEPHIFVTGPSGYVFLKQKNARRDGPRFEADVTIGRLPKSYMTSGKSWGLLVIDGTRAMETGLAFD